MAKLYPPNINGTIPAFSGTVLTVPFSMNKAVSKNEICGFALKVKTINGTIKETQKVYLAGFSDNEESYDKELLTASRESIINNLIFSFSLEANYTIGQFYKIQIAYIDSEGVIGYYSSIGVVKYTSTPSVYISGLQTGHTNTHNYYYTGIYSQTGNNPDTSEKLYSSRFKLYDSDNNIVKDSGDIIHNISEDDLTYEAHEDFEVAYDLEENKIYKIQFTIVSTNGLTYSSPKYKIIQNRSIEADINLALEASLNSEKGSITVCFKKNEDSSDEDDIISGAFLISRASSLNNFSWEEIQRFSLFQSSPFDWEFEDYTVEQGVYYKYSYQQYNEYGIYSNRTCSNLTEEDKDGNKISQAIYVDFEDIFLYDGEKQLNIRFNPKISTYKRDILETKVDTIGSKYPFITRNGNVNYKEFALSGLISHQMDNYSMFMNKNELFKTDDEDFIFTEVINSIRKNSNSSDDITFLNYNNLTSDNITAERIFKNKVLDWLTDGNPKLLRTPTEGNYLVRLMNVNMSPNDTLGRMLHSFNCTAYEIAECDFDNLNYYGIIDTSEKIAERMQIASIDIAEKIKNITEDYSGYVDIINTDINTFSITGLIPGTLLMIDDKIIKIGSTGAYSVRNLEEPINKISIYVNAANEYSAGGILTYEYYTSVVSGFDLYNDVSVLSIPVQQFIGDSYKSETMVQDHNKLPLDKGTDTTFLDYDTIGAYEYKYDSSSENFISNNIFSHLGDTKNKVLTIPFMRFYKRDIQDVYIKSDEDTIEKYVNTSIIDSKLTFYIDAHCENEITTFNDRNLYRINCIKKNTVQEDLNINFEGYYLDATKSYALKKSAESTESTESTTEIYNFIQSSYMIDKNIIITTDNQSSFYQISFKNMRRSDYNTTIDIQTTEYFYISDFSNIDYVDIGEGIVAEISYILQRINYALEDEDNTISAIKSDYEDYNERHPYYDDNKGDSFSYENYKNNYDSFLAALNEGIKNYIESGGVLVL